MKCGVFGIYRSVTHFFVNCLMQSMLSILYYRHFEFTGMI